MLSNYNKCVCGHSFLTHAVMTVNQGKIEPGPGVDRCLFCYCETFRRCPETWEMPSGEFGIFEK